MCLIAFAWQVHDDWPLVVVGNRDEFFARPTAPAGWWPDRPLLAGRDLRAGGTWMGASRDGRFAALTNFRDPSAQRADAPSRGALVEDFLTSAMEPEQALRSVARDASRYNGFNLLAGRWGRDANERGLWIVSSAGGATVEPIAPGVHALSNARLDTSWPKVDAAIGGLAHILRAGHERDALIERLFALLADRTLAADDRLPDTGVARDTERALSAAFIRMPGYGTRATTVLLVDGAGGVTFVERTVEPDEPAVDRRHAFVIG